MDLEDYYLAYPLPPAMNRWHQSVSWAARVANIVSDEFATENPLGVKMLWAHSAGGDAANVSVAQRPGTRAYDHLTIFNGRTNADEFRTNLQAAGYQGWQVKVLTNVRDLPGLPNHSLADWNTVKGGSGPASWTAFCARNNALRFAHNWLLDGIRNDRRETFSMAYGPDRAAIKGPTKTMMMSDARALIARCMGQRRDRGRRGMTSDISCTSPPSSRIPANCGL